MSTLRKPLIDRLLSGTFARLIKNPRGGQKMKLKPLGARALVKEVEPEETTASGIVLPDTAQQKPQSAEVVAVGEFENGVKVSVGDVVVVRKYSGTEVELDGEEHRIVDADDSLGVIKGWRLTTSSKRPPA